MKKELRPRIVVTYFTTASVMATEKYCRLEKLDGRIIPAPRSLTSDCGMAWCADPADRTRLEALLEARHIEYDKIAELML